MAFGALRKTGRLDLEALEMAVRSAMHQAGATAVTKLLRFPAPPAGQRTVPCACGHQARYQELRAKPVLTAVGNAEVSRPYYLCPHCHNGQFPADVELDIENTELSPGVRCMQALRPSCHPTQPGTRIESRRCRQRGPAAALGPKYHSGRPSGCFAGAPGRLHCIGAGLS